MRRLVCVVTILVFASLACSFSTATPQPDSAQAVNEALQRLIVAATQTRLAEPPPTATATPSPSATPLPTDTPLPSPTVTRFLTPTPALPSTDTPPPTETLSPPRLGGCIPIDSPLQAGLVTAVIDGNTIDVFIDGQIYRVRYTGADTPRGSGRFATDAKARNQELMLGKNVVLIKDAAESDPSGQLLRYVFIDSLDGALVNYELVSLGYARAASSDIACAEAFQQAEQFARQANRGLWSQGAWVVPTPTERPERLDRPGDEPCHTTCKP